MAVSAQRQPVEPHKGAQVLSCVNRKADFGKIPLEHAIPIASEICLQLDRGGVSYGLVGAANFGIQIPITGELCTKRMTSPLVEVFFEGSEKHVESVVMGSGWKLLDASAYFSVTFVGSDGRIHTSGTLKGQTLFGNNPAVSGGFLSIAPIPTVFFQVRNGSVDVSEFSCLPTPSDTVLHKLIRRGNRKDVEDITHIAVAASLLDIVGVENLVALDKIIGEGSGNQTWLADLSKRMDTLVAKVANSVQGSKEAVAGSLSLLYAIKDRVDGLVEARRTGK